MKRICTLLALLLLVPSALGGSQADPEITDPANDHSETTPGPLDDAGIGTDHEFSDTEILAAWVSEPDADTIVFSVETAAALKANTGITLDFRIDLGPTSVFGSTAAGTQYTIESTGTTLDAGPAASMSQDGTIVSYTVPRSAVGASGGDVVAGFTVSASRSEPQAAGCPVGCVAQSGSDVAPNSGAGREYTLNRSAPVPAGALTFVNGAITESHNGTANTTTRAFTQNFVGSLDRNATVTAVFNLKNTGTDVDTFNITLLSSAILAANNITATLDASNATLDPGASVNVTLTAIGADATLGDHGLLVGFNSTRGAVGFASVTWQVQAPPPPVTTTTTTTTTAPTTNTTDTAREPVVGKGTFLQDAAEGMGFDAVFGDWAELVLLALIILLIVLLLFLIFLLAGGRWVELVIEPRRAVVEPGKSAEFKVHVRNRKRRYHDALAYFDEARGWKTGVLLRPQDGGKAPRIGGVGEEADLGLSARDEPGDEMAGTLRVEVPPTADGADDITLHVVPLGSDGQPRGRRGARASVRVDTGAAAAPAPSGRVPVRLSGVTHEPSSPEAGDEVKTRVTVENDSDDETLRLRVVLQLDGSDIEEETIEVPPRSARAVLFPWIAGEGSNNVKVQVFLA